MVSWRVVPGNAAPFNPDDLLDIEEVAKRLHTDVGWVREKIRKRCSNAMPCFNVGRHVVFSWLEVSQWIRNSPRPTHVPHKRRVKAKGDHA